MAELDDFIDEHLVVAPAIGTTLESRGDDVRPDLEIPTCWAGSVGGAVARLFPELGPPYGSARWDPIREGSQSPGD